MSWDIYGHDLRRGYCEVHPSVREGYPCSVCQEEIAAHQAAEEAAYYAAMGQPCEGCYCATGVAAGLRWYLPDAALPRVGLLQGHPDETPPELLPTMAGHESDA